MKTANIEQTETEHLPTAVLSNQGIDFVLVTALAEERDAVLDKLPGYRKLPPSNDDIRTYFEAELPVTFPDGSTGFYNIIVMTLLGMGRVQAVTATADAIHQWHPRYVLLVGIAGGLVASKVVIGDLLISDQVVDYELQKITPQGSQIRWEVHRADPRLLNACNNLLGDSWLGEIKSARPSSGKSQRHTGSIASGDKVVAFGEVLAKYRDMWPKLIGVEMEASGVATAVFQSSERPGFFMVRGVSDLADENKDIADVEKWRLYACDAAASFVAALLKNGPIPLQQKTRIASFNAQVNREPEQLQPGSEKEPDHIATTASGQTKQLHISPSVGIRFVGRKQALNVFYQRLAYRHMKNAVYYYGTGGIGKTWLLNKILQENKNDSTRTVTDIIDFFNTSNQSIRGLQATIRSRLEWPGDAEAFKPFDTVIARCEGVQASDQGKLAGLLASLENKANRVFIECCQKVILGREVILLFDTFERAQQRYVGQWLLKEFLPQVRSLIVAIVGRPGPTLVKIPDNVVTFELEGLELTEVQEYIRKTWPLSFPDHIVSSAWRATRGIPLLIDLVFDLTSAEFIRALPDLGPTALIQDSEKFKQELAAYFSSPSKLNMVVWAMAYLKRRFDLPILKYILESRKYLDLVPSDYETLATQVHSFKFAKEYPEVESHLLHDEMQKIIEDYLLDDLDAQRQIRDKLYAIIVQQYYSKVIDEASARGDHALAQQLQAEQLGYVLDYALENGLKKYQTYRAQIDRASEYDFEELLWGEVRQHLGALEERGYEIASERGRWLREHGLFSRAESHFREMLDYFKDRSVEISKSLGFALYRQGKVPDAISVLEDGRLSVPEDDVSDIADFENLLGQANQAAGLWDRALDHYKFGARAFTSTKDKRGMAGIHINRGFLYALKGLYQDARQECIRAIKLLDGLPKRDKEAQRLRMFANMNLGTAYRHAGEYTEARHSYEATLIQAKQAKDREILCYVLQQLGINACLIGRQLRKDRKSLAVACRNQMQAWDFLVEGLEISREGNWRPALASGLERLARVYEEIARILVHTKNGGKNNSEFRGILKQLKKKDEMFQPPGEVEFQYELLTPQLFSQLEWLEKSARLFELSGLVADDANDYHRALDSLMEFARLLLELNYYDLVPIVIRRAERIKGFDYQQELFSAISDITLADMDFTLGRHETALPKYIMAYAEVAKQKGYASYLLTDRLTALDGRIRQLSTDARMRWCDALEKGWSEQSVLEDRPEMLRMLEDIRYDTLVQ